MLEDGGQDGEGSCSLGRLFEQLEECYATARTASQATARERGAHELPPPTVARCAPGTEEVTIAGTKSIRKRSPNTL